MSHIEQLNNAAQAYKSNPCNVTFEVVYGLTEDQRKLNLRVIVRSGYGSEHEAHDVFTDTLFRLLQKDGVLDFAKMFSVSLKNARFDFYRKEKRRRSKLWDEPVTQYDDESVDTPMSRKFVDNHSAEDRALERHRKKKAADVVDHLLRISQTQFGSTMTAIIEEIKQPDHKSVNALAKAHGLERNTVSRKLSALSRFYDANRFGDIKEILAV
jgi:hypothetical protein